MVGGALGAEAFSAGQSSATTRVAIAQGRYGSKSRGGSRATEEIARNQSSDPFLGPLRAHAALSLKHHHEIDDVKPVCCNP